MSAFPAVISGRGGRHMTSILMPSAWSCLKRPLINKRRRRKRAISLCGDRTHCTEVRASGNLNQDHGVAEGQSGKGEGRYYYMDKCVDCTKMILFPECLCECRNRNKKNSLTPVDICCRRHVRAASQQHFWSNIHTIYISIIEVVTASSKVLLPVECQPII